MVDLVAIEHIIDTMNEAVVRLEAAIAAKKMNEANDIRTLIFDLHNQIEKMTKL